MTRRHAKWPDGTGRFIGKEKGISIGDDPDKVSSIQKKKGEKDQRVPAIPSAARTEEARTCVFFGSSKC